MSKQYSHRNGETEVPTMQGWYFARRKRTGFLIPGMPIVMLAKKKYGKVLFVMQLDKPVADVSAQWWGPVLMPWESNA